MFKKLILLLIALIIFGSYQISAQEDFQPSGSPYAKIYFNFHSDFKGEDPGFDITRAYFGYEHHFSPNFTGDITLDVGQSKINFNDTTTLTSSLDLTAYLKQASLSYQSGNLKVEAGMIGLKQFKIQENAWGYRYIEESFQDLYELGPSADMGIMIEYEFHPMFSADLTFRNGEGYKKLQADDDFNTGIGLTFIPVEGLTLRGFYDYMTGAAPQYTLAQFIGYENEKISAGVEYNAQFNHRNQDDQNLKGLSFYASYAINDQLKLFGRFDDLYSNTLEGDIYSWHYQDDGNFIITGIEYSPLRNIKMALNYQGWMPEDTNDEALNYMYMNFEFTF